MHLLKKDATATVLVGPVLDADGLAVATAVIGDFNLTKNGTTAALASAATATHSHNGNYLIALTTGNTDTLGRLVISVNNAAMAMSSIHYEVLAGATFDALVTNVAGAAGGLQILDASAHAQVYVAGIKDTALPAESVAGRDAAAFGKLFDVATPVLTAASVNQTGDAYNDTHTAGVKLASGAIVTASFGICVVPETAKTAFLPAVAAGAPGGLSILSAVGGFLVGANLPQAACAGAGGLPTVGTNAGQIMVSGGVVNANVKTWLDSIPAATAPATLDVTGTTDPEMIGTYVVSGSYDGIPYFFCDGNGYIYWDGAGPGSWILSTRERGAGLDEQFDEQFDAWWTSDSMTGAYTPAGLATGTATVTVSSVLPSVNAQAIKGNDADVAIAARTLSTSSYATASLQPDYKPSVDDEGKTAAKLDWESDVSSKPTTGIIEVDPIRQDV